MPSTFLNKIVIVPDDPRLFAKVTKHDPNGVEVEFFSSVADRQIRRLSNGKCSHTELPSETRVFFKTQLEHWRVGRVIGKLQATDGAFVYEVKFPNSETIELHEDKLYVRCLDAFADPAEILAARCAETQYFADRRRTALRRLRDLRAAAQGLTGLISANVDLIPYQAATVRRVLQDPSLRYLLADEVGLGKTIEAGAIIRQILIDDPRRKVTVLVPESIVKQWRTELDRRFSMADFTNAVSVISHDAANNIDVQNPPDLLVIDEAHRLIAPVESEGHVKLYRAVAELAKAVPRLLLLSATPPFGDEDRLLGLLNLLDPANYPLSEREAFHRKVKEKQTIGRLLLPMKSGGSPFVLRQLAQQASSIFPTDKVVQDEAARIALSGEDRTALDASVASLRDHIVRTYRVHQRLIRTRRIDVQEWVMRPRGPVWPSFTHVRFTFDEDKRLLDLSVVLESWRQAAQHVSARSREAAVKRWRDLLEASSQGFNALARSVSIMNELFDGEQIHLNEIIELTNRNGGPRDRYEIACETLLEWRKNNSTSSTKQLPAKIVCFASDRDDSRKLYERLARKAGLGNVAAVFDLDGVGPQTSVVEKFSVDPHAWALVCDRTGEEGLNLQFAQAIFHMDLPFSPSLLEQRIGRLDRFGRRIKQVEHRILLPSDDEQSPWRAWFDVLANGLRIFSQSISDVQFRVGAIERTVTEALFSGGAASLDEEMIEKIYTELEMERRSLDEQYALDSLSQFNDDGEILIREIEETEADEEEIARHVSPWLLDVLQLTQYPMKPSANQYIRVFWQDRHTLLPSLPWRSVLKPGLDRPSTWKRRQAETFVGENLALLRPGSALIGSLERIARWDDRGIAYATWRVEPGWAEQWRGFRLIWVVEPAIAENEPIWVSGGVRELHRRAESLLPTSIYEQFVDENGLPFDDSLLTAILRRPYRDKSSDDGYRDINLGSRPQVFDQAMDGVLFRSAVKSVRDRCLKMLSEDPVFIERKSAALRQYGLEELKSTRSLNQLNLLHREQFGTDLTDFDTQKEILAKLGSAIREPSIRLDEIGFFVVSGSPPA